MTTIRTVAVHEVVRSTYPRDPRPGQEVGLAAGKAVDVSLARYSHEHAQGRRPTLTAMQELAGTVLDSAIDELGAEISAAERAAALAPMPHVLRAFRKSVLFDLRRPRSHLILINSAVGVYAQPDFWDGRSRIYELKSYRADPTAEEIALQLRFYQIAFPGFSLELVCIDRHANPVTVSVEAIRRPTPAETDSALRLALTVAREKGVDKVLEYVDAPITSCTIGV